MLCVHLVDLCQGLYNANLPQKETVNNIKYLIHNVRQLIKIMVIKLMEGLFFIRQTDTQTSLQAEKKTEEWKMLNCMKTSLIIKVNMLIAPCP